MDRYLNEPRKDHQDLYPEIVEDVTGERLKKHQDLLQTITVMFPIIFDRVNNRRTGSYLEQTYRSSPDFLLQSIFLVIQRYSQDLTAGREEGYYSNGLLSQMRNADAYAQ